MWVALIGNVLKHVRSRSFADWVSWTNIDFLHRSHRAEKRRQDRVSHGRPHSSRESSLEQDVESCKATPRVKDNTRCKTHRNGKPRKKAPRPARRRKSGEARGRPSYIDLVGLRENTLQHVRRNTRDRQLRCTSAHVCPFPRGASLNTGFSIPFLRSLKLRTCERVLSAGIMNAPSSSLLGTRISSWSANSLHKGANCFPISRSSIDLDRRTMIVVLTLQKGLSIS